MVLKAAGLADRFELIVAKEDVAAPKPDPEPYRHALGRLGIGPDEAVALEDSPTGLASARAAGLRCVAVGHRRPAGAWTGDAPFLANLADAGRVLETLGWRPGCGPGREGELNMFGFSNLKFQS
jgi:beta-phosphoglucomutase-like phosphatase (HAD superfamily)